MTALAHRVLSVTIPSRGGQSSIADAPGSDTSGASVDAGAFRVLLALPAAFLDAARGLRNDPPWASRPYVHDPVASRAHDVKVARRLLDKHGGARLAALFPAHAALLGIEPVEARGAILVEVTVVEPARPALPALLALTAGPSAAPAAVLAPRLGVAT